MTSTRPTWYTVTLTAQQPLSLGRTGPRGYVTPSHPYVPGSALRGALAAAWFAAGGTPDADFLGAFERDVRFGPCLPDGFQVRPQSVFTCKYHQGDAHEEMYDEAYGPSYDSLPAPCGSWERSSGELSAAPLSFATSTALHPGSIQVAEQQLYSRESLPTGTVLVGSLVATSTLPKRLMSTARAFVGGQSSIRGKVSVRIVEAQPPTAPTGSDWRLVSVSPTMLVDPVGRPTTDPTYGLQLAGVSAQRSWFAHRTVTEGTGGWHTASGLPKPADVAVGPGAVLQFQDDADGRAAAEKVLDHGLGLRRLEGFGWYMVAPPYVLPARPKRPTGNQPSTARDALATAEGLRLSEDVVRWLSDKLQTVRPGDVIAIDAVMKQPAVGRLSEQQKDSIRGLLRETPDSYRAALAMTLVRRKS